MDNREYIKKQFEKYLKGEASAEEAEEVLIFLKSSGDADFINALIEQHLDHPVAARIAEDRSVIQRLEQSHQAIRNHIKRTGNTTDTTTRKLWTVFISIAATLTLIFCYYLTFKPGSRPALFTVTSPLGTIKRVTLPDSSKVWLNGGTTLKYAKNFSRKNREVTLINGQAFFEVVHNSAKPFVVHTTSNDVTVYGTSFDVKSFKEDSQSSVRVKTGKVGVLESHTQKPALMLVAGEGAAYNSTTHLLEKSNLNSDEVGDWRENKLSFTSEPFMDVIHAISRKYNVRIDVQKTSLFTERITLRLDNQPLEQVMQALSFANYFKYTIHENLVVVNK